MLKRQLDGPSLFVNELVQESIIESVFGPNKNIFLAIVEFFPRLQNFTLSLADQLLHLFMRQVIRYRVDLVLHSTDTLDLAFDFRGLRRILFLECRGTHEPNPEGGQQNERTRNPKTVLTNNGELSFQLIHGSSLKK
ncbi:MAG TPA: hypothetical protein DEF45_24665 [Rhodopirellula sp.]|nr:hypothetical protein [Rhodopirellula sp.]